MRPRHRFIRAALLVATMLAAPAFAADVTPQRLLNPDREPQNWLMNHRTYDGQRFSPLARINRDNVKGLKVAYAVPIGGGTGNRGATIDRTGTWPAPCPPSVVHSPIYRNNFHHNHRCP